MSQQDLSEQRAALWALVLTARGISCRIDSDGRQQDLLVPHDRHAAAVQELRLFEEENRDWPPQPLPERPHPGSTLATLSVLLLLATFHNITRFDSSLLAGSAPDWIAAGAVNPALIREGQWWRLATALTLHANWLHLFSNLALGAILIVNLCRELGSGLAWSLVLGSGMLGNLVNALLNRPDHRSVGASTAVFGAVGLLATLGMMHARGRAWKRWLLPAAAALGLLALLGTEGAQTDLGAHLFGFVSGMVLGLSTAHLIGRYGPPGRRLNALLAVFSGLVMVWAWRQALLMP